MFSTMNHQDGAPGCAEIAFREWAHEIYGFFVHCSHVIIQGSSLVGRKVATITFKSFSLCVSEQVGLKVPLC